MPISSIISHLWAPHLHSKIKVIVKENHISHFNQITLDWRVIRANFKFQINFQQLSETKNFRNKSVTRHNK